jgi:translation initiation factor 5B
MPGKFIVAHSTTSLTVPFFSVVAGRGIIYSAIATGIFGFATTILFLFCTPDLDTLFSLDAPQPFVQLYALALGKPGSIVMTAFATIGLILVSNQPIICNV